jgi:sigma-54-specific transcriptional regulator
LLDYPWPGNIRELENVIHRALLVSHDGAVTAYDLSLRGWARQEPRLEPHRAEPPPPQPPQHWQGADTSAPAPVDPATAAARFHAAWRALLASGESIEFETLQQELALAAFESSDRNQVRASKRLTISRNIMRTYLKKAGVL